MAATDTYFAGRTVLVTGAASGIGAALCRALAVRGANLVLADINTEGCQALAAELEAAPLPTPVRTLVVAVDVTDRGAVADAVAAAAEHFGRLHMVFNNAGIAMGGPVLAMDDAQWRRIVEVNIMGVVHGVAAAYPVMVEQGFGHIINTASVAGLVQTPLMTAYSMTKHAVVGLSQGLRAEAAEHGVRVSAICPFIIDTPMVDNIERLGDFPAATDTVDRSRFWTADQCAEAALAGVARNRALIPVSPPAWLAWWVTRLSPTLFEWAMQRFGRDALREHTG